MQLRRRRLAEEPPALAAHVVAHVDRFLDVAAGLALDLPHLARHQLGQLGLAPLEHLREPETMLPRSGAGTRRQPFDAARVRSTARSTSSAGRARERLDHLARGGIQSISKVAVVQ